MESIERGALIVHVDGPSLRLVGEVDITSAPGLVEAFEVARESGTTQATLDCSGLSYLDSSGISALLQGQALLGGAGSVRLVGVDPTIRRILDLLAMDRVLIIEDEPGAD